MKLSLQSTRVLTAPRTPEYVQAIPLYYASDEEVFEYFRDHKDEIDAISGTLLTIALPTEVAAGDAQGVSAIFSPGIKDPRYPGLLRDDLPCFWLEDANGGHEIIPLPHPLDNINRYVRVLTDATSQANPRTAKNIKIWFDQRLSGDAHQLLGVHRLLRRELDVQKSTEKLVAFACGVAFIIAILVLAIAFPTPTQFQYIVFRITLALAAAGFASMVPGFLTVTISNWVRAGGALAIFVLVYFYNPAALVATATA